MKQLLLLFASVILLSVVSCGSTENVEPAPRPQGETVFTIGSIPDSVKVETSTSIKFTISQKEHPEKFSIKIDTVNPYYYYRGIPIDSEKVTGTSTITLNGNQINDIVSVIPGQENIISFSNPTAVGDYVIILSVTDKFNRKEKKEIKVKVFSPEIIIKFYQKDIRFDEKNYYNMLNNKYTYYPLSPELMGKRVDTIYTREIPKPGYPGEWTISGQSLICYISQEGCNDFNYTVKASGTSDFAVRWDGDINAHMKSQKPGFHGIMFETATSTTIGTYYHTIILLDKWGQKKQGTIIYKVFGRDEVVPTHATPSSDYFNWWGHRIAD